MERQLIARENAAYLAQRSASFGALYQRLADLEVEYASAFEDPLRQKAIRGEQSETRTQLNALLDRAGIAQNEVFFVPLCGKCDDTGYLPDGRLCDCAQKRYIDEAVAECGLAPFGRATLDRTEFAAGSVQQDTIVGLYAALAKYRDGFDTLRRRNLLLCGGTGTGKSYAMAALAYELLLAGKTVLFVSSFELSERFLRYHRASMEVKHLIFDELLNVDFLVIDDLGAEPVYKNVSEQYLLYLYNLRTERRKGTAITTNLAVASGAIAEKYGERVQSRLLDKERCWVKMLNGNDLRRK